MHDFKYNNYSDIVTSFNSSTSLLNIFNNAFLQADHGKNVIHFLLIN